MAKFTENIKRYETFIAFILLFANIILLNMLAQNIFFRIDMTDDNVYSLADASKKVVRNLDDQMVIKAYFSKDMPFPYNKNSQFLKDKLDDYKSYSRGKLTYEFVDPVENEDLEAEAQKYGIPSVQVNAVEKDKIEVKKVFMGAAILYEDKQEVLPVIQSTDGLEYDITSAINKLVSDEKKKVAFLKGNGEPDLMKEISSLYTALSDRYMVSPLELKDDRSVASDVDALIVYHPTEALSDWEKYAIDQYIMNGGKVAFLIDKVNTDLQASQATPLDLQIDDWLATYGVKINDDLVYDAKCSRINVSQRRGMMVIQNIVQYPFFPQIHNFNRDNVMVKDLEGIILPFVSSIDTSIVAEKGLSAEVLLTTSENAGTQQRHYNIDPMKQFKPTDFTAAHLPLGAVISGKFSSYFTDKDMPNPFDEGTEEATQFVENHRDDIILTEAKEDNRILVFGDGEFMTDQYVGGNQVNAAFFLNIVDWLIQDEDLITIRSRGISTRPIKEISEGPRQLIKWINIIAVPILVIVAGFVYKKVRRKRKKIELEEL